ncbi:tape measure protein [Ponticaulis profundi]
MRKAGIVTDQMTDKMEKRWDRMNRRVTQNADQMGRDVRRAIAGVAIGLAGREVTQYADAWTEAGNKIAAAGTPLEKQTERLKELSDTAIETRSAFGATATLYARLGIATENLSGKSYDLLKVTELINKATVAGGASSSERNSTIIQLSQALASGELMGEELRSLRENAPILLRAIAKEFEVPIGALKKLGSEGKLTSERILDAIINAESEISDRFSKTEVTISDSFTNLRTRVTEYIGTTDEGLGASEKLAEAINFVAENVDAFADSIMVAGAALTGYLGAQAVVAVVAGINAIATSAKAATTALGVLRAATAFMGGPWVAAATAAAAAIAYIAIRARDAQTPVEELNDRLDDIDGNLRQIADNAGIPWEEIERGAESAIGPVDEITRKFDELRKKMEETGVTARQIAIDNAVASIANAQSELDNINAEIDRLESKNVRGGSSGFPYKKLQQEISDALDTRERATRQLASAQNLLNRLSETAPSDFLPEEGGGALETETDAKTLKSIAAIEDAWDQAFKTKRELVNKDYRDTLESIEAIEAAEEKKEDLRTKAAQLRSQQLSDITNEELEAAAKAASADMQAVKEKQEADAEEAASKQELYDRVMAMRAQALGDYEALADAEYRALADKINAELSAEEGKFEALAALNEAHAETVKEIRDRMKEDRLREAFEEAETFSEGFAAQWDIMREQAERAAGDVGIIFAEAFGPGGSIQEAIGSAAGRAIAFGDDFSDSMENAARSIGSRLISSLVQLGVQMAIQSILGKSLASAATAHTVGQAAIIGQAMAGPAALTSLATAGANAAPAMAGMAAAAATATGIAAASSSGGGADLGGSGGHFGGQRERGGPVASDKFYEIAEKGRPELVETGGKFYLANTQGNVEPASKMPGMNIPDGVDMGAYLDRLAQPIMPSSSVFNGGNSTVNVSLPAISFTGPINQDTLPAVEDRLRSLPNEIGDIVDERIRRYEIMTTSRDQRRKIFR